MNGASEALERLLDVFDRLQIGYMIAGSGASSVYGFPRFTRDIDIVARFRPEAIDLLAAELQSDFYIDAGQIRSALESGRSFNIIHFQSSFKFDVFPTGSDRYQQEQFGRRRIESYAWFGGKRTEFAVASPEDVILGKLNWYKLGGAVSEQQWNDVLGVLAVQSDALDYSYLRLWAAYLEIQDLLEKALSEHHEPQ